MRRGPGYVIAGEHQVRDLDTRHRQKPVEIVRVLDHLRFCPVFSLREFAPHGIEAQFGQPSFRRIWA